MDTVYDCIWTERFLILRSDATSLFFCSIQFAVSSIHFPMLRRSVSVRTWGSEKKHSTPPSPTPHTLTTICNIIREVSRKLVASGKVSATEIRKRFTPPFALAKSPCLSKVLNFHTLIHQEQIGWGDDSRSWTTSRIDTLALEIFSIRNQFLQTHRQSCTLPPPPRLVRKSSAKPTVKTWCS